MSRFVPAITLHTWKEQRRRKPVRAPRDRYAPAGAVAGDDDARTRRRAPPEPEDADPPDREDREDREDDDGWSDIGTDVAMRTAPRRNPLRPWSEPVPLGQHLQVRARHGFRAAVVEVKPGLFVVAEVPRAAVEFGFGPLLLAPALVKTLGRAFRRSQAGEPAQEQRTGPLALPGPTEPDPRLPRWVDGELAEELGCTCRDRRRP